MIAGKSILFYGRNMEDHIRKHGRLAALALALLAMMLQVGAVSLYGQGQTLLQSRDARTGLLTMVICTSAGLKQITVDANGDVVDEKAPDDGQVDCPFGAVLSHAKLLPGVQTAIIVPRNDFFRLSRFDSGHKHLQQFSYLAIPGRSPPGMALV